MALLMGFLLAALLGIFHHFAILFIRLFTPHIGEQKHRGILTAFLGLLIVHTVEIIGYAGAYKLIIDAGWWGSLSGDFDGSFYDLIYFSGINFATLGYAQVTTSGAIRMIAMMQALGGFMVITWSATFIYTIWQDVMDNHPKLHPPEASERQA